MHPALALRHAHAWGLAQPRSAQRPVSQAYLHQSAASPLARAMIGKHEGDAITITTPGGNREYEIVAVRYID